jgi:2,3-bisphosphoglycerate-independent phosphoglycerate mutase
MKSVVVIACGISDEPQDELNGKTPLDAARTPALDAMAARGILGLTRTTPRNVPAGCHVGGLALLGCDPAQHSVDAAVLEAQGLGVTLAAGDVPLRVSLVTFDTTEDGAEILRDPFGGKLPVGEAAKLAEDLASGFGRGNLELIPGVGHRHVLVWHAGDHGVRTHSPYDVIDKPVASVLPSGPRSDALIALMERSRSLLAANPICEARRAHAERVPTALWPWAPGIPTVLPSMHDTFGVDGVMIAATPVGRGLGAALGLATPTIAGATGDLDSNFAAKVEAALGALATHDLAVVHVAAADLASHARDPLRKVTAIERIDEAVVGPLLEGLRQIGDDWRLLASGDHPTSSATRGHGGDPVPFCVLTQRDEGKPRGQKRGYSERDAREQGIFIQEAHTILERLLRH